MRKIEVRMRRLGLNGRGGFEPALHFVVVHQSRLLHHREATVENHEVGDAAHLEAPCDLRIFLRIHFHNDRFAGHVRGGARDFGRGRDARPAPARPEIHEHWNGAVLHDFIEQLVVDREGFCEGRQRRLTEAATARAGEKLGGNAILLSTVAAGANNRQAKPPQTSIPIRRER